MAGGRLTFSVYVLLFCHVYAVGVSFAKQTNSIYLYMIQPAL